MTPGGEPRAGQVLTGALFSEPMRVETVAPNGPSSWLVGLVGAQSQQFRRVSLTKDQLASLTVRSAGPSYEGDAARLKLGLQAYALGIAWEFDPYFGLSVSRVDPLPHQLALDKPPKLQLPDEEARHDRLSGSGIVGEQEAHPGRLEQVVVDGFGS